MGVNVLSLFDGMSCGRIALDRAGIEVDTYYASEIDKHAIKVSCENYPDIVRLGDVTNWQNWDIDWASIDLVLAGSPCQGFSFAGKQLALNDPRSRLFFTFVDILNAVEDAKNGEVLFLLENVRMRQEYENVISDYVATEPLELNSASFLPHNRVRNYWFNWGTTPTPDLVTQSVSDIVGSSDVVFKDTDRYDFAPKQPKKSLNTRLVGGFTLDGKAWGKSIRQGNRVYCSSGHAPCLMASPVGNLGGYGNLFCDPGTDPTQDSYTLPQNTLEKLQGVPVGYTSGVSLNQSAKMLGNGWTVDVIAHILRSSGLH